MIEPIKTTIGLWISSESSPERSVNRSKFCWLKVICCICQSNELEPVIKQKSGVPSKGPVKNLGVYDPPSPPSLWTANGNICSERVFIRRGIKAPNIRKHTKNTTEILGRNVSNNWRVTRPATKGQSGNCSHCCSCLRLRDFALKMCFHVHNFQQRFLNHEDIE